MYADSNGCYRLCQAVINQARRDYITGTERECRALESWVRSQAFGGPVHRVALLCLSGPRIHHMTAGNHQMDELPALDPNSDHLFIGSDHSSTSMIVKSSRSSLSRILFI